MNTLFTKAIRDLSAKKIQSLIIIAALSLGVIGVGAIVNVYTILKREMQKNYDLTNPPHFVINFDILPKGLDKQLQVLKPMYDWEYRGTINGRVLCDDGTWKTLILEIVPDFNKRAIDKFFNMPTIDRQKETVPATGNVFIEKAAMPVAKKNIGDKITILIPGSAPKELSITGMYHAPALPPAWMENWVYGYISEKTAVELIGHNGMNQVLFRIHKPISTFAQAQGEAAKMKEWFSENGIKIKSATVPIPGSHPHAGQMNSFLYMMQVFGLIALLLAAALVGNIFGSLLSRQKREIGIMKSLGATTGQILLINLMQVGIVSSIALLVAIPVSQFFAQIYSDFTATILNFKIYDWTVPWWGYALQIIIGLGIPLIMIIMQIMGSLKLTVREVLADYGVRSAEKNFLSAAFPVKAGFTPIVLSLRNAFRKKRRMVLMTISLSAGGILFMTSQNISKSIEVTINKLFSHCKYDAAFTLSNIPSAGIEPILSTENEIGHYERWSTRKEKLNGSDVVIYALPANATMIDFTIYKEGAVVNNAFAAIHKKKIGDPIEIETSTGVIARKISAIVSIFGTSAIYIAQESLTADQRVKFNPFIVVQYKNIGSKTKINSNHLQMLLDMFNGNKKIHESKLYSSDLTTRIENELNSQNAVVMDSHNKLEQKNSMIAHMRLIASFLTMMSVLSLIVGILSIISSVSLSVLERRKEIGILRALGTQGIDIKRLFLIESMFVGLASFILASVTAYPISIFAGNVFGMIFLKVPLCPAIAHHGLGLWLILTALLTIVFSYLPASDASECELAGLLSYE